MWKPVVQTAKSSEQAEILELSEAARFVWRRHTTEWYIGVSHIFVGVYWQEWEKQMRSAMQHRSLEDDVLADEEDDGEKVDRDSLTNSKILGL